MVGNRSKKFITALKFYLYNSYITNFPSYRIRRFYLRHLLRIIIGQNTAIHMGCFFTGNNIRIGSNTVINRKCYLDGRAAKLTIGNNVSISPEAYLLTMSHYSQSEKFEAYSSDVIIEDYVWIGSRAMVLPGVTLKKGSVLGAMSLANKDIPPFSIASGTPAIVIGNRTDKLEYELNYFPYFNTDIC